MEQNNNKVSYNMIAAILFVVQAVYELVNFIRNLKYQYFSFTGLVFLLAFVFIAILLFANKKDILLVVGFGVLTVFTLYSFFRAFGYQTYMAYDTYSGEDKFSLICMLPNLANFAGYVGITALALGFATDFLPQIKEYGKKLWYIPGACIAGSFVLKIVASVGNRIFGRYLYYNYFRFGNIVFALVAAASFVLVALWLVYPEGFVKEEAVVGVGADAVAGGATSANYVNATSTIANDKAYCSLVAHILLLLFTCGVWLYIWTYRMTDYTNQAKGEEYRNPTTKLLLCMFVPFYSIYWTYKTAMRIDKMAQEKGMHSDLSTLCLILAIFVPIIPPILMQDKVNAICTVNQPLSQSVAAQPVQAQSQAQPQPVQPQVQPQATQPVVDETELLKKYKELLDTGVITQEEFDAKKKQLLGL